MGSFIHANRLAAEQNQKSSHCPVRNLESCQQHYQATACYSMLQQLSEGEQYNRSSPTLRRVMSWNSSMARLRAPLCTSASVWSRPGENFTRGKFVERRPKISDAKRKTAPFLQRRASLFSVKELSLRCFPQITAINTPSFKDKGTSIKVLYVTTLRIIVSVVSS